VPRPKSPSGLSLSSPQSIHPSPCWGSWSLLPQHLLSTNLSHSGCLPSFPACPHAGQFQSNHPQHTGEPSEAQINLCCHLHENSQQNSFILILKFNPLTYYTRAWTTQLLPSL
jgi:hypothetical protein